MFKIKQKNYSEEEKEKFIKDLVGAFDFVTLTTEKKHGKIMAVKFNGEIRFKQSEKDN